MREILFRGKRVDGYGWVYGYLVHDEAEHNQPRIIIGRDYSTGTFFSALAPRVIPATVGQFTGLLDANGEKIFEGDIVEIYGRYFIVRFECSRGGWFPFASGDGCGCCENETYEPSDDGTVGFDVIGNIHDNPELVEVVR
jgi:hypothetical protein